MFAETSFNIICRHVLLNIFVQNNRNEDTCLWYVSQKTMASTDILKKKQTLV